MQYDLNDLYFFAQVVAYGGFAPAGRALGIPKSRLSRRIAVLEERLGIRLLQRTSRQFAVTDTGQIYLRHCQALLADAEAAQESILRLQAEPRGQIRICSPTAVAHTLLAGIIAEFMLLYPKVTIFMEVTNRQVDIIEEGFDLALRVRNVIEDSSLVMRSLELSRISLIGSPELLAQFGTPRHPQELSRFPSLSMVFPNARYVWSVHGPDNESCRIEHAPKLVANDFIVLREAALEGLGLVAMPEYLCRDALLSGALVQALPGWVFTIPKLHIVFPSRRGLIPSVRCLIDYLVKRLPEIATQMKFGESLAFDASDGPGTVG